MLRIAVIVVNYRSAELVEKVMEGVATVEGVVAVVAVDNESGDGSLERMRAAATASGLGERATVVGAGRNGGFGAGNNVGAATALSGGATPDVLWFLNPDTEVEKVDLREALQWFEADPAVGVVGTGLDDWLGGRDLAGHRDPSPVGEFVRMAGAFGVLRRFSVSDPRLDRSGSVDWVSGASLMMRASTFEAIGGFDEGFFLYFEEIDLCRRARKAGWKVIYEPQVRVVHLEGQSTGVRVTVPRPRYWYESRRRYFLKHFGMLGLLGADVSWGLGRAVGRLRRRRGDDCRWRDMWKCDAPVILGRERLAAARKS